jgi:hypothetical protein
MSWFVSAGPATERGQETLGALILLYLDPWKGSTAVVARSPGSSFISASSNGN